MSILESNQMCASEGRVECDCTQSAGTHCRWKLLLGHKPIVFVVIVVVLTSGT